MTTLICDYAPIDLVACKTKNPNRVNLNGSGVAHDDILRGLLKYGSYERYLFIEQNTLHPSPQKLYSAFVEDIDRRAQVLTMPELAQLDLTGPVVFMSTGPILHGLYNLRQMLKRFDAPCVGITHSICGSVLLPFFFGSLFHHTQSVDALICTSEAGRQVIERQITHLIRSAKLPMHDLPFRCPVIPLGVDSEYFETAGNRIEARRQYGFDDDDVIIISVGRFASRTKADLRPLLLAFAELRRSCSASVRLILAGDDTKEHMSQSLLQFCQLLGIEPYISIRPNIKHDEKLRLLAAADVFVAPSDNLQETFGLSVIEAMAAGLPVVAADWNGFKDTVVDGQTGILVPTILPQYEFPIEALSPVGSMLAQSLLAQTTVVDIPSLTHALKVFVENPDYRRSTGELARRRAWERYHMERVVKAYEQLWESLLEESADKQGTSAGECLYSYPPTTIFSHYGTNILTGKEKVSITAQGSQCLDGELNLLPQIAGTERMFRAADLLLLLDIIREDGLTSIETIEKKVLNKGQTPPVTLRAAIARLLKFGLICHAPPSA